MRVYVGPHARENAVHAPGIPASSCTRRKCKVHTSDWRDAPGSPGNLHRVEPSFVACDLDELASRHFRSEAHFVLYEVFDVATGLAVGRQPRITKDALPWLREQGLDLRMHGVAADVDTPGHAPWEDATLAQFRETWEAARGPFATVGAYLSPKGYRAVQPFDRPLVVEEGERFMRAWLEDLIAAGAWSSAREVKDWTRHFRTPHHLRNGVAVRSPWQDWSRCTPIVPVVPDVVARTPSKRRVSNVARREVTDFDAQCPAGWEPVADVVGAAIRDHVTSDWRRCYLALAGALVERGCPPEGVPAVVGRAHLVDPQWASLLEDRVGIARATVVRWGAGLEISGAYALRARWAPVADALDHATSNGAEATVLAQLSGVERRITDVSEATATLRREIRDAYGVVLLAGPPGLGKTEAVIGHAKGLAKIEGRAAPGSKIGLSAPTTALAVEIQQRAAAAGVKALRVFGPLGHTQPDGTPTCVHHAAAVPLVAGSQSLERLFCEPERGTPCEHAKTCPARHGLDGPHDANLIVGPHELVGPIAQAIGKVGTLVVDEPPALIEVSAMRLADLNAAIAELHTFEEKYARHVEPALRSLAAWASAAEPGAVLSVEDAVLQGAALTGLDGAEVVSMVRAAVPSTAKSIAPPLTFSTTITVRRNVSRAEEIGRASGVCVSLFVAVQPPEEGLHPTRVRVIERERVRVVSFVGANDRMVRALRRDAPTVVLDAGAALVAPTVERIVGYKPRLVELDVSDGAPVERTVLACGRATRSRCFTRGTLDLDALVPLLRAVFAWAGEDGETKSLVIVSWGAVEALLAVCLGLPQADALVRRAGLTKSIVADAGERLGDVLRAWQGRVRLAHYGGLRGLDHLRDADALATIGDPRPTVDAENDRCAWLEVDPDGRIDALAAAELDQAHGRLRLVHRERKARALHVGAVVPAGWCGREVTVRRMAVGRPPTPTADHNLGREIGAKRLAAGLSVRALSLRVGISPMTLSRYESGERVIPAATAVKLAAALSW